MIEYTSLHETIKSLFMQLDDIMEEPAEIAEDDYALEEPEEVAEELSIHQQNGCFELDVLQPLGNKTKQDAENMAVKLLAARLRIYLFIYLF